LARNEQAPWFRAKVIFQSFHLTKFPLKKSRIIL
jgi:hypothetical protein